MNSLKSSSRTVFIGRKAHTDAEKLASGHTIPAKRNQIYLNTLAVHAVREYLEAIGIKTDLQQGDRDNPCMQALFNLAVLDLPNYGKLECCPILPGETAIDLALKPISDNLIGYIAVEFDGDLDAVEQLNQGKLLGFFPATQRLATIVTWDSEQILRSELKPLDTLFDCLLDYVPHGKPIHEKVTDLMEWLKDVFDVIWQPIESFWELQSSKPELFGTDALTFEPASNGCCEKSAVYSRGKLINLNGDRGQVVLSISLSAADDAAYAIVAKVQPTETGSVLPANLEIAFIMNEEILLKSKLQKPKESLQIEPDLVERGDHFDIQVAIDDFKVTESFVLGEE
jgi:hypothetical protein